MRLFDQPARGGIDGEPDADPAAVAGTTTVDDFTFPSLLRAGSLTGTQFHPEKSGPVGRALLRAFAVGRFDGVAARVSA